MPATGFHSSCYTGKQMYFESELPEDMKAVIEKWRKYSVGRGQ